MFRRDARLSRLRDDRIGRLYGKSLLLRILFVFLMTFGFVRPSSRWDLKNEPRTRGCHFHPEGIYPESLKG